MTPEEISKFLSYVLRHEPEAIGLALDSEGWAGIESLLAGAGRAGKRFDRAQLEAVVASSDKKRFALSADGSRIRAVQGHSTRAVAIAREARVPPELLYHGTAERFVESIARQGLIPGARQQVHLSADRETARAVGSRYGRPVVLQVQSLRMHQAGYAFFQAENGVWLTERVPAEYLIGLEPAHS